MTVEIERSEIARLLKRITAR